jgi:hypothetical protein
VVGGAGDETVSTGDGDDSVVGSAGNDSIVGGGGVDTLDYSGSTGPVFVNLDDSTVQDGLGGTDTIDDIDVIKLTDKADTVVSGAGDDSIDLGGGDDSFTWDEGDGNDTIDLGPGKDTLDLEGWTGDDNDPWDTIGPTVPGGPTLFVRTDENGDTVNIITVFGFDPDEDVITCFAEGTRIATARGEVPVEQLRAGDLVVAAHGGAPLQPLVWVGRTEVNVARQRNKAAAAPVLIKAGALADGVPFRDLRVSPEHAIFLDGRLVPARMLVNGTSIVQELWVRQVTYYHVELEHHGLVVSEGAVTETYFDDGNRHLFDNAKVAALAVDFEAMRGNGRYLEAACAPVVTDGDRVLATIRARLRTRRRGRASARPRPVTWITRWSTTVF